MTFAEYIKFKKYFFLGDGAVSDETGEKTIKSRGMTLTSDVAESKAFKINTKRQALKIFIFHSDKKVHENVLSLCFF